MGIYRISEYKTHFELYRKELTEKYVKTWYGSKYVNDYK